MLEADNTRLALQALEVAMIKDEERAPSWWREVQCAVFDASWRFDEGFWVKEGGGGRRECLAITRGRESLKQEPNYREKESEFIELGWGLQRVEFFFYWGDAQGLFIGIGRWDWLVENDYACWKKVIGGEEIDGAELG